MQLVSTVSTADSMMVLLQLLSGSGAAAALTL